MDHFTPDGDYPTYYDSSFLPSEVRTGHPAPGNTVSVTPIARMKTYGVATVPQQTRHARRIYVGGIPPNYLDEDTIRSFVNSVIAQGLKEENDHSYVLSVYVNQKKCFAFVELKSIELATACLELDGIMMKSNALRILRANEYKPELIPQSLNKMVRFDLSSFQFGAVSSVSGPMGWKQGVEMEDTFVERPLDSIIQFANLSNLEAGSVTIVGFPFDESHSRKTGLRGNGCTLSPKHFRAMLKKVKCGYLDNPEFEVDLTRLRVVDVGDVLPGKSNDETKSNLTTTVSELLARGSIPFVVGGSMESAYHSTLGLLSSVSGSKVTSVYISAHADIKLLDDSRFYGIRSPQTPSPLSCQGRFIAFAAQGSEYSRDEANYIRERGGRIVWSSRDLLQSRSHLPAEIFQEVLRDSSAECPISVTIDAGVLNALSCPRANTSNTVQGLAIEDLLSIVRVAGSDPNVVLLNVTEFSPESDESRLNLLLTDIFYHFLIGFSTRKDDVERKSSISSQHSLSSQQAIPKERRPSYPEPGLQRSIFLSPVSDSPTSGRPPMSHNSSGEGFDSYHVNSRVAGRNVPNSDPLLMSRQNPPLAGISSPYFQSQAGPNKSFGMTIDSPKPQTVADVGRTVHRSLSTISSMSSNPNMDRFYRTSSSSSYNPKGSAHSFNYSSSAGAGGFSLAASHHPIGISSAFSQSIPDIINELHPFDESLDLNSESRRRKSFQDMSNNNPSAPETSASSHPKGSSNNNSGSGTPTAIGGKTVPPLPPHQLAVSTFSSDTIVYPNPPNVADISQQSPSTVVTRSFHFEEIATSSPSETKDS